MKRQFTLFALLGTLLLVSNQKVEAQDFKVGLRDGMSLSWLVGIDDTLPQASFYAGITSDLYFGEKWGVGLDVTLSEQGALCNENSEGVITDYSFHYLNIPLMAHYRLPIGSELFLQFSAGGQAGIFLSANCDYTAPSVLGDGRVSGSERLDSDSFHPLDFGVVAAIEFGTGNTSVEVRYALGITQTHNGISNTLNGNYYISVPDNRNSVLQIGTILRF